jgi:hypothetical protein
MTRLSEDFNMYYSSSYIGYRDAPGETILPFYIEAVNFRDDDEIVNEFRDYQGDLSDSYYDSEYYNDYSEMAYPDLIFSGIVYNYDGTNTYRTVAGYRSENLVFDNPLSCFVRYSQEGRSKTWFTYRTNRSVKKGVANNRISVGLGSPHTMLDIFKSFSMTQLERDYWVSEDGFICYRHNVIVGKIEGDQVTLDPEATHLTEDIEELFPQCQITVAEIRV